MADIVITEFMDDAVAAELARSRDVLYDPGLVDRPTDLVAAARAARALIVRNRTRVDAALLDQCPRLEAVGRLGVGMERIDLEACRARGVAVFPARGANAIAVAEYVIGSLLILLRGAFLATEAVLAGRWPRRDYVGREACSRQLGLIGFGDIARHVARRAEVLGLRVSACDPLVHAEDPAWRELRVTRTDLVPLLEASDAISLHVPLTGDTRNLIDASALARMKRGAVLINTSRGGIVDEAALIEALRTGHLGGAAIDVFAREPLDAEAAQAFADLPNVILTPHIAGVTEESNRWISVMTVDSVVRALDAAEAR